MDKDYIVEEIEGLFKIIKLQEFRKTPGVVFDVMGKSMVPKVDAIDRVLHLQDAISPGPVEGDDRPWYMHPYQDDNLLVLRGERHVELWSEKEPHVHKFVVTPEYIEHNGKRVLEGGGLLVWPTYVFHRVQSGKDGSASVNMATHYEGFDIKTNFNIYSLNPETGEYKVAREGHKDQK
ncbi:hypothetical protein O6R05_05890 [Peptoniphilus equinus]|uniref:Uncharacterized protein n=1 Tax=Peptoniphilus equinus TaxID=3016343 RepID=A0ABY7QU50_9FIRM|nr:hypothetical protein [Peptoniphilus equinus]WBW49540.1 hypothetical protein O6R05_05890 [Peptoniphilus equinus]